MKILGFDIGGTKCAVVTADDYAGALEIVSSTNTDKNAIRFDLTNTEFTNNDGDGDGAPDNEGRFTEKGYKPIYNLYLDVSAYAPYIDSIGITFNNQSTKNIRYNFGVSDGTNYSKIVGKDRNSTLAPTDTGIQAIEINTDNLYRCSFHQTGSWSPQGEKWNNDFDRLFLRLTADYGAAGYIDIEDITITYTITANDENNLNFQLERKKALITDFEIDITGSTVGTTCDFATSGKKAAVVNGAKLYKAGPTAVINHNPNYVDASGFSYWVYLDVDAETEFTITAIVYSELNGVTTRFVKGEKIAPKKWTKVFVDFANITKQLTGDNWYEKTAEYNYSMTVEEIAAITKVSFLNRSTTAMNMWVDDIYLDFSEKKADKTINLTAENITLPADYAAFENGKVVFAPGAETRREVIIDVPSGTLSGAAYLEYHYTTSLAEDSTAPTVQLYANGPWTKTAATNWTNWAYQIKRGLGTTSGSLKANTSDIHILDFYKTSGSSDEKVYAWYNSNFRKNNTVSAAAAATEECLNDINKITFGVDSFGTVDSEEFVTLDKLVVKYADKPYTVSSDSFENGDVKLFQISANEGDKVGFTAIPDDGFMISSLTVTDLKGNRIELNDKSFDAQNIGGYFTFDMPASNVTIEVGFESITSTIVCSAEYSEYDENDVTLTFDIPVMGDKAYNIEADAYQVLSDYGVIITSEEALNKYSVDISELTPETVKYYKESGHYLGQYIYMLDSKEAIKSEESNILISFDVKLTDITIRARRAPLMMATYAQFVNSEEEVTVYDYKDSSIDSLVYGENFRSEFYALQGINYSQIAQNQLSTMTSDDRALNPATWQEIADKGFDHVRLPINMANGVDADGNLIEENMLKIDKMIDNAICAGLSLVVDVHGYKNINGDYDGTKDEFQEVWVKLADRYAHLPLSVAFEILNEPRIGYETSVDEESGEVTNPDPMEVEDIMELQEIALANIRATKGNEERIVIIGTNINLPTELDTLSENLLNAENIIIDVHNYSPIAFAYSGINWGDYVLEDGSLRYPAGEKNYDASAFRNHMETMFKFREDTGIELWIGEYGAYMPDAEAKLQYIADFNSAANEYNFARCMWEYGTSWGPYSTSLDQWDDNMLYAIFNAEVPTA